MSKLRGLPQDDEDVRYSKTLAYLLRHGAEKHGLPMRRDGFVAVKDLLQEPTLKSLTFPHLYHLVENNNKKRFVLFYGIDPSPNRPQRKKKQQGKSKKGAEQQVAHPENADTQEEELPLVPAEPPRVESYITDGPTLSPALPNQQPPTPLSKTTPKTDISEEPEWFIRAAQGHSIQTVTTEHLEQVLEADEEGKRKVGEMVHGTKAELWDSIRERGLSRGTRQHIHLARARSGATSGPRANSTLYIYLSLPTLLSHSPSIPVFISSNNVVLTPGGSQGVIPATMFEKVVRLRRDLPHRAAAAEQSKLESAAGSGEVVTAPLVAEAQVQGQASGEGQSEQVEKPKRDRKNREKQPKPTFIEEVVWEHGAAVDPPRRVVPDSQEE